jgi:translation initiation factor IF-1
MLENKGKDQKVRGVVVEALPNTTFLVRLDEGKEILCYLSGKMRKYRIKVLVGDKVEVEMSFEGDTKGRIVKRF